MGLYVMSITEMGDRKRMENGSKNSCLSVFNDQEKVCPEREKMVVNTNEKEKNDGFSLYSSSSDSSIGKNSDQGLENTNGEEEEVQSSCNDGALGCLQALEEALPRRRGISSFCDGPSKSYFRLEDVSSITDIAKHEDPQSRKRKISLAREMRMGGRISKKLANLKTTTST